MKRLALCALLVLGWSLAAVAGLGAAFAEERQWRLPDGTPLTVEVHPAAGDLALLWLPVGFSREPADERRLAEELAERGLEVWRPALLEAHFLPPLESSLERVPAEDVAALIERVHAESKKPVIVLAEARAGLLALRGAAHWQAQQAAAVPERSNAPPRAAPALPALRGLVLLYPNLILGPPEPGTQAVYHPAVAQAGLPVFLIQPELSPWRWRLVETARVLGRGGADVYVQLLPGVRDRFYFRPDATVREGIEAPHLGRHLARAAKQLLQTPPPLAAGRARAAHTRATPPPPRTAVGRRGLHPYQGDPTPPTRLALRDLQGRRHTLDDHRGEVVLVNFWASWCPPCVHEMPSMQRLKKKMARRAFTILAVNMGEDEAAIRAFLAEEVQVDFPLLLDRDGTELERWKVFVFPTSFLLDRGGRIRYAVFGEHQWDSAETLAVVEGLLGGP